MKYIQLFIGKEYSPSTKGMLSFKLYETYEETKLNILLSLSRRHLNKKIKKILLTHFKNEKN